MVISTRHFTSTVCAGCRYGLFAQTDRTRPVIDSVNSNWFSCSTRCALYFNVYLSVRYFTPTGFCLQEKCRPCTNGCRCIQFQRICSNNNCVVVRVHEMAPSTLHQACTRFRFSFKFFIYLFLFLFFFAFAFALDCRWGRCVCICAGGIYYVVICLFVVVYFILLFFWNIYRYTFNSKAYFWDWWCWYWYGC